MTTEGKLTAEEIDEAHRVLSKVVTHTPLAYDDYLSKKYRANVYLKREDMQRVRSFKIRGAYYNIIKAEKEKLNNGVVAASAGNHAQGVADTCHNLKIQATIFMPVTTPNQKVEAVKRFGGQYVTVILVGDTFDEAQSAAFEYTEKHNMFFVASFDDRRTMAGQGTVAVEVFEDAVEQNINVDYLIASVGGGGLIGGLSTYSKKVSPQTTVVGVEPETAQSMKAAFQAQKPTTVENIDHFVDGAAVARVSQFTYNQAQQYVDKLLAIPEGKVAQAVLDLYTYEAIVAEPAGAMPIASLDFMASDIVGKNVVLVVSGGNNDIGRMQEMEQKALMYKGRQQFYLVEFPQRPGALRQFVNDVLGPNDDITRFEYTKKINSETGSVMVGILLDPVTKVDDLTARLAAFFPKYINLQENTVLFNMLV
ncbi:threonine ammonia-lyase IlvA [Leuconostoc mesenteroides]|uniref:threonine ammonia-lyase IlvA n=1 Tax=Leuconostoc mesenteroides TaxID=1245 RepID=UPI00235EF971|nr:threonine ammonia-lyase IlvA [Leuconostoc mesenteroides]